MSFKNGVFILALALAGCGLKTGEKAPGPTQLKISGNRFSCVSQIASKVEDYLNAKMSDDEITSFMTCLQNAFVMFDQNFHGGSDWNTFSPVEIRTFLETYFLPADRKISDELLHQFMVIKQNLIGGEDDRVTRSDLAQVHQILDLFKQEAIRLRPFIPILNPTLVEYQDPTTLGAQISAADKATKISSRAIGELLSKSRRPYRFQDFHSFLTEFRGFVRWDEHFEKHYPEKNWNDLFVAFKTATVSPDDSVIAPEEWVPLFQSAAGWYLSYLKFQVGVRNQPLLEGNGFKNFAAWGDGIQELVQQSIENQPERRIPFSALDRLVVGAKGVGWLPKDTRPESMQSAFRAVINKILGPEDVESSERASPGVTRLTLANLAVEWSQWEEVQMALQERFVGPENRSARMQAYGSKIPLLTSALQISQDPRDRTGWNQFRSDFDSYRPLFKEDYNRVFLAEERLLPSLNVTNGFYNLSWMNVFRTALDLIYKGYASNAENFRLKGVPMEAGLSQKRLESFYQDFRQLGIDIGFIDSRNDSAGSRTYLEAKSFTYLADGVEEGRGVLTYAQAVQEGAFLFSGGELSRDLYKRFEIYCRPGALDLNGVAKLDRACVRQNMVSELVDLITTMPGYTDYLRSLDAARRLNYADALMNSALRSFSDPKQVELSELATMAMIVHYSEAIMTRYNENLDDHLSEAEINRAVPVFRGLIVTLAAKLGIWAPAPENAFKFILANGRLPKAWEDFATIARHGAEDEAGYHESWGLNLDRTDITRVFAAIVQGMMVPAAPDGKGSQ